MPKQISSQGHIWYDTQDAETKIGFTPEFIEKLQECLHIIPGKQKTSVRANGPLMAVETNTGLFSITSPVQGIITFFDNKAMNFPEKLTADDTVCIVSEKKKEAKTIKIVNDEIQLWERMQARAVDWGVPVTPELFGDIAAAPPPQPPAEPIIRNAHGHRIPLRQHQDAWRMVDRHELDPATAERVFGARVQGDNL